MKTEELYKSIETNKVITEDITNILLELDVTNSITTQASLNNLLVELRDRIRTERDIIVNTINKDRPVKVYEFDTWILEKFTPYSSDLYQKSIKQKQ